MTTKFSKMVTYLEGVLSIMLSFGHLVPQDYMTK